jgi:hypothetical protein
MAAVVEAKEAPALVGCKLDVWKGRAVQRGGSGKENLRKNRAGSLQGK